MPQRSRTAKGNGSVRRRPDGRWEGRCSINGVRKSFYGEKQSEVLKAMRKAQKEADEGRYVEPTKITLARWLDTWLTEYVKPSTKPLTFSTYQSRVETHIKPALGKIKVTALEPTQIQAFYNDLLRIKGLSPRTIKNIHGILHEALDRALKLRYIPLNPSDACILPRVEKKEINPLTENDVANFLAEIQKDEPLKELFTVALFTGMREGEICGLPWSAVDFESGIIAVKQQLCKEKIKGGKHYIDTTKNDNVRYLTAAPFVMEILKNIKARQEQDKLVAGELWENEFDLVFTNPLGHFILPQTALKRFKAVAVSIGRADARFHDLRHTYAVTALQEGDDIKTVQQNLGHATASFTLDVYGHVSEKMKKESAARMQSYFEKISQ